MSPRDEKVWWKLSRDLNWEWVVSEEHLDQYALDEWRISAVNPKDGQRWVAKRNVTHEAECPYGIHRTHEAALFALFDVARRLESESKKSFELRVAEALMED